MNYTIQQFFFILGVCIYFFVIVKLLKKHALTLQYSLLWLIAGLIMLVLAVFPAFLGIVSNIVGIVTPTNALFAILFFCLIILLMSVTSIVSKQSTKIKTLVQNIGLLEKRVRELESNNN